VGDISEIASNGFSNHILGANIAAISILTEHVPNLQSTTIYTFRFV